MRLHWQMIFTIELIVITMFVPMDKFSIHPWVLCFLGEVKTENLTSYKRNIGDQKKWGKKYFAFPTFS